MADNQVEIEVVTKTDLSDVKSLEELVDEIKAKAEEAVELNIEIGQVTSDLEEATAEVERLQTELANIELGVSDADFSEVTSQLDEAESKVEELSSQLDELNSKTVSVNFDTSAFDEASGKAEETASSMDNITTAAAGLAATAGIEQMITTADNINNSWNRLELTFAGTGVSIDTLKSKASELSDVTGRSGGTVRDYFNQMGIAGVDNANLLSSSFEALSGKAYQTNQSIESMEGRLQRMIMTGQASGMSLQRLGIDAEDLANAMGVSAEEVSEAFKNMTPEERLQAITKAMGEGKEANEMYKDSYAGLKDRADAAMAGLAGAVGQAILPIVIPALEAATNFIKMLADGFKSLPGPVQGAIGAVLGIVAIGTTLIGTLGMVGKVIGTVKTGLETIGMLGKITSVISSISGAFSSLWGVIIANPIILVVVAVIALIAALIWAYNNVDWFREMVDNAWASIQGFAGWISGVFMGAITGIGDAFNNAGQTLQDAFTGAVQFVQDTLQGLYDYIMTLGGLLPEGVNITGNQIIDSILAVMMFISTLPFQIAMYFANIIASTLGFGDNFVQTMINSAVNSVTGFINQIMKLPGQIGTYLNNSINHAINFAGNFVNTMIQSASDSVTGFVEWITQLPGKLAEELDKMIQQALDFAANLPGIIAGAAADMVSGWIFGSGESSPGFMYDALIGELFAMVNAPPQMLGDLINWISTYGYQMADTLSQALLGISFDSVINGVLWLLDSLNGLWNWIATAGGLIPETVNITGNKVIDSILRVLTFVATLPVQLGIALGNAIGKVLGFGDNFVSNMINSASQAVSGFLNSISEMAGGLANELSNMLSLVGEWAATLPQKFWDAGVNAVKNFLSALGIASPGTMQRMLVWEVTEMGKRVPEESRQLLSNVSNLGEDIVKEFGNPTLGVSVDSFNPNLKSGTLNGEIANGGYGGQINFYFSDITVDNDDRMEKIYDYITRRLHWNNKTAGRGV